MSETKFTPGPWEWADGDIYGAADGIIRGYSSGDSGTRPNEADRDLIAAAPDLYAALDKCEDLIARLIVRETVPPRDELNELYADAAIALSKARGEEI